MTPEAFYGTSVGESYEVRVAKLPAWLAPTMPALPINRFEGQLLARLAAGVTLKQAESATEALYRNVVRDRFGDDPRYRPTRVHLSNGQPGNSGLPNTLPAPPTIVAALPARA